MGKVYVFSCHWQKKFTIFDLPGEYVLLGLLP